MKPKTYNWKPVIGSLLKILQDHCFELVAVDSGNDQWIMLEGTPRQRRQKAKAEIVDVEESYLCVKHPSHAHTLTIFVVLGDEPEETAADHTSWSLLNLALEQFEKKWAGKPCPQH